MGKVLLGIFGALAALILVAIVLIARDPGVQGHQGIDNALGETITKQVRSAAASGDAILRVRGDRVLAPAAHRG